MLACLKQLLVLDSGWLPAREGYSLYIRPFMFSSCERAGGCMLLGTRASKQGSKQAGGAAVSGMLSRLLLACVTCLPTCTHLALHPCLHCMQRACWVLPSPLPPPPPSCCPPWGRTSRRGCRPSPCLWMSTTGEWTARLLHVAWAVWLPHRTVCAKVIVKRGLDLLAAWQPVQRGEALAHCCRACCAPRSHPALPFCPPTAPAVPGPAARATTRLGRTMRPLLSLRCAWPPRGTLNKGKGGR